ncbi:MAG: glycosyltransferase family 4 protein [Vicingus serpentipes]|nr:glycosyltransferase family 4 protein [Vicingus serpentipes]
MNKKYNILFLSSWYPNKTSPQAGNFVQKHAHAVAQHCHVSVLHVAPRIQKEKFVIEQNSCDGVVEVIVYYQKITSKIPLLGTLLKFKAQLAAYQKGMKIILNQSKKIDLVHLNVTFPSGFFALHLKKKLKIPFIITEHWTAFLKTDPTKINFIEKHYIKKIAKQAEAICPVSEDLKKAMVGFGINHRYHIIPNVVNTNIFIPNPPNNNKIGILHLSNLKDEHKNITGIINVVKKLSQHRNDFKVTIAGNGDIKKFKQKSDALNISEEILSFEGEKTTEEVAELMNKNDIFLLFSNYENLPCVIAEALVMGLPTIASNVGGIAEMVNEENGVLVHPKNEEELFQKLNELINNIKKYNKSIISNKAQEKYSYETVGKAYLSIYESILN